GPRLPDAHRDPFVSLHDTRSLGFQSWRCRLWIPLPLRRRPPGAQGCADACGRRDDDRRLGAPAAAGAGQTVRARLDDQTPQTLASTFSPSTVSGMKYFNCRAIYHTRQFQRCLRIAGRVLPSACGRHVHPAAVLPTRRAEPFIQILLHFPSFSPLSAAPVDAGRVHPVRDGSLDRLQQGFLPQ
nr:hypothetical protein [Tanacetum cinerariifolium]